MKTSILLLSLLMVMSCFAFSDCISTVSDNVSLWEIIPVTDFFTISLLSMVIFALCFLALRWHNSKKYYLPDIFVFVLFCLWSISETKVEWDRSLPTNGQFRLGFSFFVFYFFFVFKYRLLDFFSKLSENLSVVVFSAVLLLLWTIPTYFGTWSYVGCGQEMMSGDTMTIFIPVLMWIIIAWLLFCRSWRVLIVSLPFSFLFLYFGRLVSMTVYLKVKFLSWDYSFLSLFNQSISLDEIIVFGGYFLLFFFQLLFFAFIRYCIYWRLKKVALTNSHPK